MMDTHKESDRLAERYLVSRRLGTGGSGDAYLAFDKVLRRNVVIKRVRADGDNVSSVQEILEEASKMAAMRHPNVVAVYDVFASEDDPCIIMEYVAGDDLDERVSRTGPLSVSDMVELARQTLEALAAAHAVALVHRDLKPSNIMISELAAGSFLAKILDFGMAKFIQEHTPSPQTVAIDGTICGTIHFISPEQLSREPVDQRSDLYSLGCCLYFAVTGHNPFPGQTIPEVITSHFNSQVVSPSSYRPELSPGLDAWLMRLLKRAPMDRFPTAVAALQALYDAALADGVLKAATAAIPSVPVVKKKRFPVIAGATVAMIALAGIATWFLPKMPARAMPIKEVSREVASAPLVLDHAVPIAVKVETVPLDQATPKVEKLPTIEPSVVSVQKPQPVVSMPPAPQITYEVVGSNTIGAKLMPALIMAYLQRLGATELKQESPQHEEMMISFLLPSKTVREAVFIRAHGSSTSFQALEKNTAQLGMSSRSVKTDEIERLSGLGDMLSRACEHVVGLDGLAVIVNQSNPISALTVAQVAGVFSGEITDWSEIGGPKGAISIYARDDKSGTFDSFRSMVLGDKKLRSDAKRFEDSNALSDDVAANPGGIGFIGLPYVRNSKSLALSDAGTLPKMPSPFTVATEDYVLSRRLFLYSPAVPSHPWTLGFIEFALSDEGQEIVERVGFIPQTIEVEQVYTRPDMPPNFREFLSNSSSQRLSLTFRFRSSSAELDAKSVRDLDRVVRFLARPENRSKQIYLLGFSDASGGRLTNLKLSEDRVKSVAQEFCVRGITPVAATGMGPVMPVASNDSVDGQNKNRRVEVWIR